MSEKQQLLRRARRVDDYEREGRSFYIRFSFEPSEAGHDRPEDVAQMLDVMAALGLMEAG